MKRRFYSLEDSKDLSTLSFVELINALHAVDQRIKMRVEYEENKGEEAFFVKNSSYKGKEKNVSCNYCKKIGHRENDCCHKGKPQCYKCKRYGHIAKKCRFLNEGEEKASMAKWPLKKHSFGV